MELSLDTASEVASIALSSEGRLTAEMTWRCRRNHTVELMPSIERLLTQAGAAKADVSAVFVCTGPGMYTGLRVGISVAKGLAYGLGVPIVGVGRLEVDAYAHGSFPGRVIAVHQAGRGEYAWAAYGANPWREVTAPRLDKADALAESTDDGPTLFVGEVDEKLREALVGIEEYVIAAEGASIRRAGTLAELGFERLQAGRTEEVALLKPVYLRPPAIGPQPPAGG